MNSNIVTRGHPNVSANHKTTIEITKEDFLTPRGDCIIGVSSNKACADLSKEVRKALKRGKKVRIVLECGRVRDTVTARGNPLLTLDDNTSIVIRKSGHIDGRTLCIRADKAAADLDRELIEELKKGKKLEMTLSFP
jgi:hypothetical protein